MTKNNTNIAHYFRGVCIHGTTGQELADCTLPPGTYEVWANPFGGPSLVTDLGGSIYRVQREELTPALAAEEA